MRVIALICVALGSAALLASGCAVKPAASDPAALGDYNERNDPFEPTNRKLFAVNATLDHYLLHPVATGYRDVVPAAGRRHLHNVLSDLGNPVQLSNDVLQGKPRKAGNTFMRLVINTTLGIGGVFDVATEWGFPDHDTDFGLTLAVWGAPGGPYLFLPVLGPNNPRDAIGYGINSALDPFTWVSFGGSATLGWARFGVGAVDGRERLLQQTDSIERNAVDLYATYRSLYQQHRAAAVIDGRADLPATTPDWYRTPTPLPQRGAAPAVQPTPNPRIAPPRSLTP